MQVQIDQPENRDLKEAELSWAGKHYYRGLDEGLNKGRDEGLKKGLNKGRDEGLNEGRIELRRQSIADLAGPFQFELSPERQSRLQAMTLPELNALWQHLLAHRAWPEGL